jgi:hypothetical protein
MSARALHQESLALKQKLGDRWGIAASLYSLGRLALRQADYLSATSYLRDSLALWRDVGGKEGMSWTLEDLAWVHARQGKERGDEGTCVTAARLFGAAETLRAAISTPLTPVDQPAHQGALDATREVLPEASFARAWDEGSAWTLEEAIAFALEGAAPSPANPRPPR